MTARAEPPLPFVQLSYALTEDGGALIENTSTIELEVVTSDGRSIGLPPGARGHVPFAGSVRTPPGRDYSRPAPVSDRELYVAKRIGMTAYRAEGVDFLWITRLHDGRALFLEPWNGGGVQLSLGHIGAAVWINAWDYDAEHRDAGWRAVLSWDGHDEPEGWTRHPMTGRVRPDGKASSERLEGRGQQ